MKEGNRFASVRKAKAALEQAEADEKSGRDQAVLALEQYWIIWKDAIDNVVGICRTSPAFTAYPSLADLLKGGISILEKTSSWATLPTEFSNQNLITIQYF